MLAWIASLIRGVSLTGWVLGGAAAAALAYVAGSQLVLHNRQAALDAALADKAILSSQLDQVQALNADNLRVLAQMEEDHRHDLEDLGAKLARAQKAGRTLIVVQQENARDPDAGRPLGDVCPLLDRYLERVRDEGGTAAAGGGGDPGSREEAPGRPADVRGRAGGPASTMGR